MRYYSGTCHSKRRTENDQLWRDPLACSQNRKTLALTQHTDITDIYVEFLFASDRWRKYAAQVSMLKTCQQGDGELLSLVFLSRRDSHPPDAPRILLRVCWSVVVPCAVLSSIAPGEHSAVTRVLIAIDRAVISWCSRVSVKIKHKNNNC